MNLAAEQLAIDFHTIIRKDWKPSKMRSTRVLLVIAMLLSDAYCGIQVYDFASGKAAAKAAVIKRFVNVAKFAPEPTRSVMGTVAVILIDASDVIERSALEGQQETLDSIEHKINSVMNSMSGLKISADILQSELKLQAVTEYQANLKAEYENFGQLIINYGTDMDKLREELGEFIKSYKYKNIVSGVLDKIFLMNALVDFHDQ